MHRLTFKTNIQLGKRRLRGEPTTGAGCPDCNSERDKKVGVGQKEGLQIIQISEVYFDGKDLANQPEVNLVA